MRKRAINIVLLIVCLNLTFLTLAPLFLSHYVGPKITRRILEAQSDCYLLEGIEFERAGITILGGFGVEFKRLKIRGPEGKEIFRARNFLLRPWFKSLLLGRLKWKRAVLRDPSVQVTRTPEGNLLLHRRRKTEPEKERGGFLEKLNGIIPYLPSQVFVHGGSVRFTDFSLGQEPVVTTIDDIALIARNISAEGPLSVRVAGKFAGGRGGSFNISSEVLGIEESIVPTRLELHLFLEAEDLDSTILWPYVQGAVSLQNNGGQLHLDMDYHGGLSTFRSSGEMRIQDARFTLPGNDNASIGPTEATLTYDLEYQQKEIRISQFAFRLPRAVIEGSGQIRRDPSQDPSITFEFQTGKTALKDIRPYLTNRFMPEKLRTFLIDGGAEGFLQIEEAKIQGQWGNLNLEGIQRNPNMLSLRARLEGCTLRVDSELPPVRNISGLFSLKADQVIFHDLKAEFIDGFLREMDGSISHIYTNPIITLRYTGDLNLGDLLSLLKSERIPRGVRKALEPIGMISGRAEVAGEIRHPLKEPADLTYQGRLSLKRSQVKIAGLPHLFSNLQGEIQFDENRIHLSRFTWTMGDSPHRGEALIRKYLSRKDGEIVPSKSLEVDFSLGTEETTLDHFLPKGEGQVRFRIDPESIWLNSNVRGKLKITRGSLKGRTFRNLSTSLSMEQGLLKLKQFQADASGGSITFGGWVNFGSRRGIAFKLIPRIQHIDMGEAVPITMDNGQTSILSGTLTMTGIITGSGDSLQQITNSLSGDLRFRLNKGTIHGLKPLKGEGLEYKQATGRIRLKKGVASTTDLYLDSDVISMNIQGEANLREQALDIHIEVRPLQTMDKILSNVPVAGWLLAGKDRSILTFSYHVEGKFDDLRLVE